MGRIFRSEITGLVLAGGEGRRMAGADKGLVLFEGKPLVQHALERLAPQVDRLVISANRHLDTYRAFGWPVLPDGGEAAEYQGPLAGILAGLQQCETPWLVAVPCDSPRIPADLVERLMSAVNHEQTEAVIAATRQDGRTQWQPLFCALRPGLHATLKPAMQAGTRSAKDWLREQRHVVVTFEDAAAFVNMNDLAALRQHAQ